MTTAKTNEDKPVTKKTGKQIWLSVSESSKLGVWMLNYSSSYKKKENKDKVSGNRYALRLSSIIEFCMIT
jgi:uncharacterized protein YgiM (DUF1202 family)